MSARPPASLHERATPPLTRPLLRSPNAINDVSKNHWKPLVAVDRTADVTTHDFTAVEPFERRQAWGRACLRHHHWGKAPRTSTHRAHRLQLTRPKWLAKAHVKNER